MTSTQTTPRVLYGVTAAITARAFLPGQLRYLSDRGWEVHLVCGEGGLEDFAAAEQLAGLHTVLASRDPSSDDPRVLLQLLQLCRRLRPDAVVFGTPKMGVFGILAATLARVPQRTYLVHGYRADGLTGPRRVIVKWLDRLACRAATDVVAVSASLTDRLVEERVTDRRKVVPVAHGSANGVDLGRFEVPSAQLRARLRNDLGLPGDAQVVAVVGRLTRDKGLPDLPDLWREVVTAHPEAWLLVAGTPEPVDAEDRAALERLAGSDQVRVVGHVPHPEQIFQAADVHVLLSRREGLGMVALEASACGVPTVAFNVTGVRDAVAPTTGVLVPPGDLHAVSRAIDQMLSDEEQRAAMSRAGVVRVVELFARESVWSAWHCHLARSRRSAALENEGIA